MNVPQPLEITASLMAGYTFEDGSVAEVAANGDYRITDKTGRILDHSVNANGGMWFGTPPKDYGEIMSTLAAFLMYDGELYESTRRSADPIDGEDWVFGPELGDWAYSHGDELGELRELEDRDRS